MRKVPQKRKLRKIWWKNDKPRINHYIILFVVWILTDFSHHPFDVSSKNSSVERSVMKSPLHTIHHCSQPMTKLLFRKKKLSFVKPDQKRSTLHTIRHRPQFSQTCVAIENTAKKVLWIRQKTAYSGERNLRKSFSQNTRKTDELLSTHYSHFAYSFLFRHCSRIVCSRQNTKCKKTVSSTRRIWRIMSCTLFAFFFQHFTFFSL